MLDTDTRRRIDTARDILVGKVPDPKSQVEQITIALIYKFMDDMDAEAEELGGKRKFFAGEFARFGWPKLLHPGMGGQETLNLYAEAIARMPENPGVPPLFRNIFKNAYLPYRDPETLKLFLKTIDEFTYDHSERLGDAFEYLLSVLGSQGDAGQFRTPRHIIDFIVAIVNPQKHETILDPACGTAGFLISAYKHILRENSELRIKNDEWGMKNEESGMANDRDAQRSIPNSQFSTPNSQFSIPNSQFSTTLTPDEKGRLGRNLWGYDISPDMVRLSLVNLYLHGFADPRIYEYDTLTSEDRWNEVADVILANPPFMSPKGGIQPHKRFSVKSKRSEVLFVDYIAEHLTPAGRAGIIVPEGIIFQSQKAYQQLRKMLVETALVAVISLPAGVFQPYSGVKTSILILDKARARRRDAVAFFKVEHDGFGLGAQRRPSAENDLPAVLEAMRNYELGITNGEWGPVTDGACQFLVVPKAKLAANEYNLSGERYREGELRITNYELVKIGDVCTVNPRKNQLADLDPNTRISFVPMADLNENQMSFEPREEKQLAEISSSYTYFADNDVLLAKVTPCFENGKAGIARGLLNGIGFGSSEFYVLRAGKQVLPEWIYFCVMHPLFREAGVLQMTGTGGLQRVPKRYVENFQIPLPPLEVQREIVAEIEGYQRVIDGARAVLAAYRPHIHVDPEWPLVEVKELSAEIQAGFACGKSSENIDGVPHIRPMNITETGNFTWDGLKQIKEIDFDGRDTYSLIPGDVLFNNTNSIELVGKTCLVSEEIRGGYSNHITRIRVHPDLCDAHYLATILHQAWRKGEFMTRATRWVGQAGINTKSLSEFLLPLPPLEVQREIVAEIEAEQRLVEGNRELITRFERKIQTVLARVWHN